MKTTQIIASLNLTMYELPNNYILHVFLQIIIVVYIYGQLKHLNIELSLTEMTVSCLKYLYFLEIVIFIFQEFGDDFVTNFDYYQGLMHDFVNDSTLKNNKCHQNHIHVPSKKLSFTCKCLMVLYFKTMYMLKLINVYGSFNGN